MSSASFDVFISLIGCFLIEFLSAHGYTVRDRTEKRISKNFFKILDGCQDIGNLSHQGLDIIKGFRLGVFNSIGPIKMRQRVDLRGV